MNCYSWCNWCKCMTDGFTTTGGFTCNKCNTITTNPAFTVTKTTDSRIVYPFDKITTGGK